MTPRLVTVGVSVGAVLGWGVIPPWSPGGLGCGGFSSLVGCWVGPWSAPGLSWVLESLVGFGELMVDGVSSRRRSCAAATFFGGRTPIPPGRGRRRTAAWLVLAARSSMWNGLRHGTADMSLFRPPESWWWWWWWCPSRPGHRRRRRAGCDGICGPVCGPLTGWPDGRPSGPGPGRSRRGRGWPPVTRSWPLRTAPSAELPVLGGPGGLRAESSSGK